MACACNKRSQQRWEVVTPEGKSVFDSASKPTAQTVSNRYPGSKVQEVAKPAAASK
ncbi:hypothetical protein [Streptomyces cyaneofuscatus]|uniref:hypothetical protein n=1 Tax=Streptomyces cyaneofuscatus TaxID=66883 RepID=UPI0036D8DD8F